MPSHTNKTDFVYTDLRGRIADGEFTPGSCLHSEKKLMNHYKVSRTVIRLSLGKLENEKLIYRRKGSGTYISPKARDYLKQERNKKASCVAFVIGAGQQLNPFYINLIKFFNDNTSVNTKTSLYMDEAPRFDHYFKMGADLVFIEGGLMDRHPVIPAQYLGRVVLINRISQRYGFVCTDNNLAGKLMVKNLADAGHKKIGLLHYGLNSDQEFTHRLQGIYEAFDEFEIMPHAEVQISLHDYSKITPHEGVMELLGNVPDISAIITVTDMLVNPLYEVAEKMNISIPDDISIISVDDLPFSRYMSPSLTTIRQPVYEIAVKLTEIMGDYINKGLKALSAYRIPPRVIVRDSVREITGINHLN